MEFSSFLKEIIKKRGYSYRKLGSLSGVNHTYISKICKGSSSTPSPDILRKLAVPLCVPYEDLFKAAGYLVAEKKPAYAAAGEENLLFRVARLTPEGKDRLSEFLDFLEDWERKQRRKKRKAEKEMP